MAHDTELTQGRIAIPVWERYTLSIEEAAVYFRIGENKLRRIISENRDADFILWNGNRPQGSRIFPRRYERVLRRSPRKSV